MEIEGSTCEYAEKSEIVSITQPPFTVALHKTFIQGALYRVEGSDSEDKYELILLLSHFNGQDCKDYISGCPKFIEKLFQSKLCRILTKDSQMICQFDGDILSATITLQKVIEPPFEALITTVKKQEKKIAELQEENKQLERKIRQELKDSSILQTLSSQVQQLENTIKKQEKEILKLKDENKQLDRTIEDRSKNSDQFSLRIRQLEKLYPEEASKTIETLKTRVKNLEDSLGLKTNIVIGKWVHTSSRKWTMSIEKTKTAFSIQRCHMSGYWYPNNVTWKNGVMHWMIEKLHDANTDSHYRFDPENPNIITEINGSVENTFHRSE